MSEIIAKLGTLISSSGITGLMQNPGSLIMILIGCIFIYLAIAKKYEPLLLLPIAFGMILTNLPGAGLMQEPVYTYLFEASHNGKAGVEVLVKALPENLYLFQGENGVFFAAQQTYNGLQGVLTNISDLTLYGYASGDTVVYLTEAVSNGVAGTLITDLKLYQYVESNGGLLYYLYQGVKLGIYPPLIFLGVGAMTDFGPLIANPKSLLLGAAAQLGIFLTFIGARLLGFSPAESGAIGIIGGADGPTAIFLTGKLAAHLLGPIALAAYSYMALVPVIQPPIMRALTTKKERNIVMEQLRPVSKREKIIFPIVATIVVSLLLPSAAPLIGMLMLGNLLKESGVTDRLCKTAQNELMNIVTILLGVTVGATATAETFLQWQTLGIIALGIVAFSFGTAGGVLLAKLMNKLSGGKINPLIGSAGVSAVPMAARVSQLEGLRENPNNHLLMHAMGPNVAGVIGSAIAAGVFLSMFGK